MLARLPGTKGVDVGLTSLFKGDTLADMKKALPKMKRMSFSGNEEDAMFRNDGKGHFDDVCYQARLDFRGDGRSEAFADLDGDGDLDLVVRQLQKPKVIVARNDLPPGAHWVTVRLHGVKTNREGIGAIVRLRTGDRRQTRPIRCGHGYGAQGPAEAHFGLGAAEKIDELVVEWPTGKDQRFEDVAPDAVLVVTEDAAALERREPKRFSLGPLAPPALDLTNLRAAGAEGEGGAALAAATGKRTLVNLWAPWCAPCKKEAPLLTARARACGDAIAAVGLSAEGDLAKSRKGAAEIGLGLPIAAATPAQLAIIDRVLDGLPLPATLAFGPDGKLTGAIVGAASESALERLFPCPAAPPR